MKQRVIIETWISMWSSSLDSVGRAQHVASQRRSQLETGNIHLVALCTRWQGFCTDFARSGPMARSSHKEGNCLMNQQHIKPISNGGRPNAPVISEFS